MTIYYELLELAFDMDWWRGWSGCHSSTRGTTQIPTTNEFRRSGDSVVAGRGSCDERL
ncbi:putative phospholipid-transporting ATPase VA isoform [Sesbania bispinosa]|nr:putative phospholipid-transporting ATPase VA isoform [Sesbania bispinosa]